jgi:hypothetical protein
MSASTVREFIINQKSFMRLSHFTWQRSVLAGAGLAYACGQEKYWHTPLIVVAPSAYAGYQLFKAREHVRTFVSPSATV